MDMINSCFEFVGGFFVALNCARLYRDKKVRGVTIAAVSFFVVWGFFNLVYYPSLEQWWSAAGALSVAIVNTVWLGQMIYYTKLERKNKHG